MKKQTPIDWKTLDVLVQNCIKTNSKILETPDGVYCLLSIDYCPFQENADKKLLKCVKKENGY